MPPMEIVHFERGESALLVTARFGLRTTRLMTAGLIVLGTLAVMLSGACVDLLPGPAILWLGLQAVLAGAGASIAMVAGFDLPARVVPSTDLGTVMGAQRALTMGVMPLAALGFGVLGSLLGIGAATWAWLAAAVAAGLPCVGLRTETEQAAYP